jgi:hypothetical protein
VGYYVWLGSMALLALGGALLLQVRVEAKEAES